MLNFVKIRALVGELSCYRPDIASIVSDDAASCIRFLQSLRLLCLDSAAFDLKVLSQGTHPICA